VSRVPVVILSPSPVQCVQWPESVTRHVLDCYLTATPNVWGCHDPQCGDSTWDHECPTPPCTVGASEALTR
jgi:hypothetical protein